MIFWSWFVFTCRAKANNFFFFNKINSKSLLQAHTTHATCTCSKIMSQQVNIHTKVTRYTYLCKYDVSTYKVQVCKQSRYVHCKYICNMTYTKKIDWIVKENISKSFLQFSWTKVITFKGGIVPPRPEYCECILICISCNYFKFTIILAGSKRKNLKVTRDQ